ncbi:MAG: SulP family inorganic anion transporter [Burkholderiales bacterium]|nr:SulP family inorganic anion transporter [Burkholderiales bacterium]
MATELGTALPAAGLAGLRHWRHDLVAGLQVALLWTPFSLGVAVASGAPPIAGLISAVVAGLLYPLLGGSHVTVSGPAAALAPVVLWGMLTLGGGDLAAGYPLVLVAIVLTGLVQLALAAARVGQYAAMLPATVVEAMLAAIGIMIVVRQVPALFGVAAPPSPSVVQSVAAWPHLAAAVEWTVAPIGLASLALMFALRRWGRSGPLRWLPSAIVVAAFGVAGGWLVGLPPGQLVRLPTALADSLTFPAFAEVAARPDLWLSLAVVVVTFTMIDGVESVASVKAVDKIDPWRRKSDANRTLRAMGVCNLASGLIGGLTVIPNAVPSRANIDAGARTLWSNLYSGLFLLLFVFALPGLLGRIPLAAIAGVLVYIGWRLCEPALFARMLAVGRDRFLVFVATVAAILATDLLVGMLIGIALELVLLIYLLTPSLRFVLTGRLGPRDAAALLWKNFSGMFRSPVIKHRTEERAGVTVHVLTMGSLVGFNLLALEKLVERLPARHGLALRFTESARIIDHTAAEFLQHVEEEFAAAGRPFAVEGLANFYPFSAHPLAARMQEPHLAREQAQRDRRAQQMAALAAELGLEFSAGTRATVNRHGFIYLRRGDQREESNLITGVRPGGRVAIFDYGHTSPPDYHVTHRHTLLVYEPADPSAWPEFVLTPGHYLERYLVGLREAEGAPLPEGYRLYTPPGGAVPAFSPALAAAIAAAGPLYLESRRGALLAFCPHRELEEPAMVRRLHALAADLAVPQPRL